MTGQDETMRPGGYDPADPVDGEVDYPTLDGEMNASGLTEVTATFGSIFGNSVMTVGQLREILAVLDDDTQVVVDDPENGWWLNVPSVILPAKDESVGHWTLTLLTADTFDPRQF